MADDVMGRLYGQRESLETAQQRVSIYENGIVCSSGTQPSKVLRLEQTSWWGGHQGEQVFVVVGEPPVYTRHVTEHAGCSSIFFLCVYGVRSQYYV